MLLDKHVPTAESHIRVLGQNKKNFFFFFYIHRIGDSYIILGKHDQAAESHPCVLRPEKKNFSSSSTYTGWRGIYLMP